MAFFSGRQVAHPTDTFIRNVALVCLAFLAGLLLYERITVTNLNSKPGKTSKTTVSCWVPSHFTSNDVKMAVTTCSSEKYHYEMPSGDSIPTGRRNKTKVEIYPSIQRVNKNAFYYSPTTMEVHVTCQAVLVLVAYLLLKNVGCRAGTQARILAAGLGGSPLQRDAARGLSRAFCTTVTYIIIQVGYFISMIVMVGKLRNISPSMWKPSMETEVVKPKAKMFLCDFERINLGNTQRYTVQCVSVPGVPEPEQEAAFMMSYLVLYFDTVLCGAVALMLLLHLVQTLLLSSASSDVIAAYDLQSPPGLTGKIIFGCTDMNLAAIFLNVIGHPQMIMMNRNNDRITSSPVYSDAIQMDPTFQKPSDI